MTPSRRPLLAPLGVAGAAAVALAVALASPAAAHNFIVSSTPAEGEALTALPEEWVITTNETLLDLSGQGAGFALLVSDDAGQFYGDGCVTVEGESLSMPAALGSDGTYTLTYQFVSADGHTLSGELPFTWQAPADFEPHVGLAEPPVCGETSSAPAPEPTATAEPEPEVSDEPVVDAEAVEPADDGFPDIGAVAIGLGALALIGAIVAFVMATRNRSTREAANEPGSPDETV